MVLKKFFILAATTVILCACNNSDSSQSAGPNANEWCMDQVKNSLKDPGSANFKDIVANIDKNGNEALTFCSGMVNAKNAMGGYVGFKKFTRYSDGSVSFSD